MVRYVGERGMQALGRSYCFHYSILHYVIIICYKLYENKKLLEDYDSVKILAFRERMSGVNIL